MYKIAWNNKIEFWCPPPPILPWDVHASLVLPFLHVKEHVELLIQKKIEASTSLGPGQTDRWRVRYQSIMKIIFFGLKTIAPRLLGIYA